MKNTSFAQKVLDREAVILYELLPPPKDLPEEDLVQSLSLFAAKIKKYPVAAVNIPEVREETRCGERNGKKIEKCEPREVGEYLQEFGIHDLIINRPVVYIPWNDQKNWLVETYKKYLIRNFVFVGGESHKIEYPGYSVSKAVQTVKQTLKNQFPDILIGGITIPARNNEAGRVFNKTQAGIDFFSSQIIYEAETIKKLLKEYWELCRKAEILPKPIFLSFAPITMKRDIELLTWLGVQIPQKTCNYLSTGWLGMGWRSQKMCDDVLQEILEYRDKKQIPVPLGLNIGHVNRHNFEPSFELLDRLSKTILRS